MIADIGPPRVTVNIRILAGINRLLGDLGLRERRTSRQLLNSVSIEIAARKIHFAVDAAAGKDIVYWADPFDQCHPIDFRDHAHAGYDIANRNGGPDLSLLFVRNSQFSGGSAFR